MSAQILIEGGENWFEFSKSKTGQLDYIGKWVCDDCDMPRKMQPGVDVSDKDTLSYLVHAGALLCAVEDKDSMLCVELLLKQNSRECVMMELL